MTAAERSEVPAESDLALSIIIPVLDDAKALELLLTDLDVLHVEHEIVVVDGGSHDTSVDVAQRAGALVVRGSGGRGPQLIAGVQASRAPVLCFLHADVRVSPAAADAIETLAIEGQQQAAAFTFRIAASGWRYRFIEFGTDLRSRWASLPYGDQGLVISRHLYEQVGGFPAEPLMEDVALIRALKRVATIRILDEPLIVSDRRWRREGPLTRMFRNWALLVAYLLGVPPRRLVRHYPPPAAR